jgi:hypothetical protein
MVNRTLIDLAWDDWPTLVELSGAAPALLLGWSNIPGSAGDSGALMASAQPDAPSPSLLVRLEHQYGGHACLQSALVGLLVPLQLNAHALRNPTELAEVFEEVPPRLDEREPALSQWLHGAAMDDQVRTTLDRALSRWLDIPAVRDGREALIAFSTIDAEAFLGWKALEFRQTPGHPTCATARTVTPADLTTLMEFARALSLPPPGLWMTWENRD